MQYFKIPYALKKIPFHSKYEHMLNLLHITEEILARIRWKALFSLHTYVKGKENMEKIKFKCKTRRYPHAIDYLAGFEKYLHDVIGEIKIRKLKSNFQKKIIYLIKK